jgi:hypothetical protein
MLKKGLCFTSLFTLALAAFGLVTAPVTFNPAKGTLAVNAAHAKDLVDFDIGDDGP